MGPSLRHPGLLGGVILGLLGSLVLCVGCTASTQRTVAPVSRAAFAGVQSSDATEALAVNGKALVRQFSSASDADWYTLGPSTPDHTSLQTTASVGLEIEFFDVNRLGIGKIQTPVGPGGWQSSRDPVLAGAAYIKLTQLEGGSLGSYSVQLAKPE